MKIVINLDMDGEEGLSCGLDFEPSLITPDNEKYETLTEDEKLLNNYALHIVTAVVQKIESISDSVELDQ